MMSSLDPHMVIPHRMMEMEVEIGKSNLRVTSWSSELLKLPGAEGATCLKGERCRAVSPLL